jgi:ESF2/ABP1 family protein
MAELGSKKLDKFQQEQKRRGVIYLSRIPPYMKPEKIRHLLGQHGALDRIYLAPEDSTLQKKRVKSGGNKRKMFTEGWVEFLDKRVAKHVAESLNNTALGGKKGFYYREDIWNMRYLKKFKWHHLTEKMSYEKSIRDQRLKVQISQARRENTQYMEDVDQAQRIEHKTKKLRKFDAETKTPSADAKRTRRAFNQTKPIEAGGGGGSGTDGKQLLNGIFVKNKKPKTA